MFQHCNHLTVKNVWLALPLIDNERVNNMNGMATVTKIAGETVGQEFLVFTLGDEEYGIDILKVQEIRGYDQVTRIANTPEFIRGVTNLRGVIVPIIDLRVKFAQPDVEYNENTVVIVLNLENRVVGIVVDGVSDVLSLTRGSDPSFTRVRCDHVHRVPDRSGCAGRSHADSGRH